MVARWQSTAFCAQLGTACLPAEHLLSDEGSIYNTVYGATIEFKCCCWSIMEKSKVRRHKELEGNWLEHCLHVVRRTFLIINCLNFPIPGELHCQFLNCFLLIDAQCHPRRVRCIWTAWKHVCIGWESLSVGKYITKSTTLQYSKFSVKLRLQSGVVSWKSNDRIVIPVIVLWCWL